MRLIIALFLIACILIYPGCASTYKQIRPAELTQMTPETGEGIAYSYQYNVLGAARNKKSAKKEEKKGVRVIAVQFQNNTGRTINFRNDVRIYMGEKLMSPLETSAIKHQLKQLAPVYLLYFLLWPYLTVCDGSNCETTYIPIGIPIGLINLAIAASANKKFEGELMRENLIDREIKNGETVSGLIGIQSQIMGPIRLSVGI